MLLPLQTALRATSAYAVDRLADVDYNVANRVTEDVAKVVHFAYEHDMPKVASTAVHLLQIFDNLGSLLISFVVWIVAHTP